MPTFNLPLPYPLEIGPGENEGRRIAGRELRPLLRRTSEPLVDGESDEHEKEYSEAQQKRPSFSTEPRDAPLVNARGVWNPEAKPAVAYSWDWGGNGDQPRWRTAVAI